MPHVLLVDDEPSQRQSLRKILESQGIKVAEADSVNAVSTGVNLLDFNLVITELRLPDIPGSELIQLAHPIPVIVMTNYASLRSAVDAMKKGAVDYLAKPCSAVDLLAVVQEALTTYPLVASHQNPQAATDKSGAAQSSYFEGTCPSLKQLNTNVKKVAQTDSTVLILGETGTGKELTARQVHEASHRANRRIVAVNCAAIPDSLIESELFGYEKGAFTGANTNRIGLIEAADGGTLFLDEIGELPLAAQARLLRFIQEGEIRRIGAVTSKRVDVRLICATHRDLSALAQINEFRQDLYYRINVLPLKVPPLRERGNDIRAMAEWFAAAVAQRLDRPKRLLSDDALDSLLRYRWPGNVRELEHAIERGVVMADRAEIGINDLGLPQPLGQGYVAPVAELPLAVTPSLAQGPAPATDDELSLEDYFQRFVLEHQDSMSETELAKKLGISRKCLWERRQRLDMPRKKILKQQHG